MKRIKILLCILMFSLLIGCNNEHQNSKLQSSDTLSQNNGQQYSNAILFLDEFSQKEGYAYVVGKMEDEEYKSPEKFKYNGKSWEDFLETTEEDINTDLIGKNDDIKFYSFKGESFETKCLRVDSLSRGIDFFNEIHAKISLPNKLTGDVFIGFSTNWNPLPRIPVFSPNEIKVDFDGNNVDDKITIEKIDGKYTIKIVYNEKVFSKLIVGLCLNNNKKCVFWFLRIYFSRYCY